MIDDETVYFGRLSSKSGAIRHTGDEKEGDEDLGQADDEVTAAASPTAAAHV